MRTKLALFVEGDDFEYIKHLARTLGHRSLVLEVDVSVVPLQGSGNFKKLESFDWIAKNLLKGALKGYVLFDRDFLSVETMAERKKLLEDSGLNVHFWQNHELESYLIVPSAISRLSGLPESDIINLLSDVTQEMRSEVLSAMLNSRYQEGPKKEMPGVYIPICEDEIEAYWSDPIERLKFCPAKEILAGLNSRLQDRGQRAISISKLAASLRPNEISSEVKAVLQTIQDLSTS
jgi:hypothetical protein